MKLDSQKVVSIAQDAGWALLDVQLNIGMVSFSKNIGGSRCRVNVYCTKGTVGTSMIHPVKGPTQLFRRLCTYRDLEVIFGNPRAHTGKGYYKRENRA